ncbi:MAG TPA: hypothetical protein VGF79_16060 [Bacteroidia bacterium]
MNKLLLILSVLVFSSFAIPQTGTYLFVMLKPIPGCDGKCNNYEIQEFTLKSADECKKQQDSCIAKYGNQPTYYTVAPGEAVIYYKYNKFVTDCDCKIKGVHKSTSVEKAKEEMNQKIAEERVKKPKAYHNYEVIGWWPK